MFLFIDTTGDEIILGLLSKNKLIDKIIKKARYRQAELLLLLLDKLLKKNKVKLNEIKGIMIMKGPGSFTGTRIGVSTANALAFALNIPILGTKKTFFLDWTKIVHKINQFKKINRFIPIKPIYFAPPPVTKKKSKLI